MITFPAPLPEVAKWGFVNREGVSVSINNFSGSQPPTARTGGPRVLAPIQMPHPDPTRILVHAETATPFETVQPGQLRLPDEPREAAERALSEMAGIVGILSESQWEIASPRPYLMVSAETEEERDVLQRCKRVILPAPKMAGPFHGQGLGSANNLSELLSDRPDGVLLLGAATHAGYGVAKLHELFRVLENGFGCAGRRLVEPLAEFLQSYPNWDLGYDASEVEAWVVDLRDPATHADLQRSKRVAYDSDVERHLHRIEQAAYDVLFNKGTWGQRHPDRLMRWAFSAASRVDGSTLVSENAVMRSAMPFDHFGAFPLSEGIRLGENAFPDDWLAADWYFSEADWDLFNQGLDEGG